ncbi:hypothetical protein APSETT444_010365 [Aspergillus pseudonomiae]
MAGGFLPYHEPGIVEILIIISFFFFLSLAEWVSAKVLRAGIIGQIAVGIIYGVPLANILEWNWQQTFLALGYVGLILIIFEGGLGARLDLLKENLVVSTIGAATGVSAPNFENPTQTHPETNSIISDLGKLSNSDANLGWIIGRPIVASVAMAILTPVVTKFLFAPIFRKYIEFHFARYDHISNIILMTLVLCAFISIAAYTGTSVLFGAFLAGTFLSYLPSKRPDGPFVVMSREEGEQNEDKSPTFVHTFEAYLLGVQTYLMEPLFFASIGFAIPFVELWTGKRIWRGILYTLLMVVAKFVVGIWIPIWKYLPGTKSKTGKASKESPAAPNVPVESPKDNATMLSALLLGSAMVARGEIGLLIIEIGYNSTEYVSEEGFITGVWAILLNTIIGPVTVGLLVKFYGARIGEGEWGLQKNTPPSQEKGNVQSAV